MKFTCKLQLAKHEIDEMIDKGEVDFQQFQYEFNAIDWDFEADRLQFLDRTWPTIGVTNHENGTVLWTSAYRPLPPEFLDEDEFRHNMPVWFTVKLDNPPNPPEITSFNTGKQLADCYFQTYVPEEIEDLFEHFFNKDYEMLYESLYSMNVLQADD